MGLKPNRAHKVRMMGQVEAAIAAEERKSHDTGGRPPVINDLDEDVRDRMAAEAAAAEEEAEALEEALADESATIARRLERYTRKTEVCVINAPRAGTQKRRWRRESAREGGRAGENLCCSVGGWVGGWVRARHQQPIYLHARRLLTTLLRAGKKLLVLDLDHTLLHFSNDPKVSAEAMKRPYMQTFMATVREWRHGCSV
jgi:hypothetical protein